MNALSIDSKYLAFIDAHPNANQATDGQYNWGYWAGGFAETGEGMNLQRRPLTFSAHGVDGVAGVIPLRPFIAGDGWLEVGDEIRLYPGCDGNMSTCREKFDNLAAMGAQPFTPAYIEEAAADAGSSGGK